MEINDEKNIKEIVFVFNSLLSNLDEKDFVKLSAVLRRKPSALKWLKNIEIIKDFL